MEALVLAGGQSDALPVPCKADLQLGERTMVEHVVEALQQVPQVTRITVAREDSTSLLEHLLLAVRQLGLAGDDWLLIAACDIPLVTAEAVSDFLTRCEPGFDFYYPIIRREACERRFPGVRRTYARLREGTFTGGNLFLLQAGLLPPLAERLERIFAHRKSPLRLSRELGLRFTAQFALSLLFGTLAIAAVERRAAHLTGLRPKAVISEFAEIGTDIDKISDFELLRSFF